MISFYLEYLYQIRTRTCESRMQQQSLEGQLAALAITNVSKESKSVIDTDSLELIDTQANHAFYKGLFKTTILMKEIGILELPKHALYSNARHYEHRFQSLKDLKSPEYQSFNVFTSAVNACAKVFCFCEG